MPRLLPLIGAAAAAACTLEPSALGDLPAASASEATGEATTVDGDASGDGASSTSAAASSTATDDSSTTSDSDGPAASGWQGYCEHVNAHGGACDPDVDVFPDLAYPGRGFIVHEWGTDTIVAGSDGAPLRGLHHEEEDLPPFVYDRLGGGGLEGSLSVHVKMETPVTYFYSDTPRSAQVSVTFPDGVFSQWYPAVARFEPFIARAMAIPKLLSDDDPVLNPHFPFASEMCRDKYASITGGLLDWGTVEILGRDADAPLPAAPLAETTWSYARAVDANLVRIAGVPGAEPPQHERFLFYRGLGNFPLPLSITAGPGGALTLDNASETAVGRLFVVHVDGERGAFFEWGEGVESGQTIAGEAPPLASAPPLDLFVDALAERVTEALDATGLYHDEAVAMVETWRRQWFRTPGLRVLYLVPQAWTDASIPLHVSPAPMSTTRVMMIRSEVLTPEQEAVDVAAAGQLASPDTAAAGKQHFIDLGRFGEPRLRRAAALLGDPPYLAAFLAELVGADTRVAAGE